MALVMEVDGQRGRIALNTALLENQPGELLVAKEQVMAEANERAGRARSLLQRKMEAAMAPQAQEPASSQAQEAGPAAGVQDGPGER